MRSNPIFDKMSLCDYLNFPGVSFHLSDNHWPIETIDDTSFHANKLKEKKKQYIGIYIYI